MVISDTFNNTNQTNGMHLFISFLLLITCFSGSEPISRQIGIGRQPAVAGDPSGSVHVVYGQQNTLFYATSRDGERFDGSVRVDSLPGLHIGVSRGPQIAATAKSVVIAAIDKSGTVWAYSLDRRTGRWQPRVRIIDVPGMAQEGFVALSAGTDNVYYAVWLDLRNDKQNKIVGSRSADGGRTWSANQVLYQSPDGTVCECCQLSVVSQGQHVAVMFRNFLNGSRDMYLLQADTGNLPAGNARKLGEGTWKLNACPMDGGGLFMAPDGSISTVWRRENRVFKAKPGQSETEVAEGKQAKIVTTAKGDYLVFQQASQLMAIVPGQAQPKAVGSGAYPKLIKLPADKVLCVWEQSNTIWAQFIQ